MAMEHSNPASRGRLEPSIIHFSDSKNNLLTTFPTQNWPYRTTITPAAPYTWGYISMKPNDLAEGTTLERLKLMIYLVPIFGVVPAAYRVWQQQGSRQEQSVSRLVITLALTWVMVYGLLSTGSHLAPGLSLRFLISNTLVTTGYTLTNLVLMVRLLQGKSVKVPGFSRLSRRWPD
jgi:hypothetical protein